MANCANGCGPLPLGFSRCTVCNGYTTVETGTIGVTSKNNTITLDQVKGSEVPRLKIGEPYDSVWGGGLVPTTTTMLAASAGCGKTTMMLGISSILAKQTGKFAYYISAEQPASELKLMCERLQIANMERIIVLKAFGAGAEFDKGLLKECPPCIFVNDSVTDMAGKDSQMQLSIVKSAKKVAIECNAPAVLICHMNKDGDTAGLYRLHHTVDTLIAMANLLSESDREIRKFLELGFPESFLETDGENIKCICAFKNRHGPTGKDHYLYMTQTGLVGLQPPPKPPKKVGRAKLSLVPKPAAQTDAPSTPDAPDLPKEALKASVKESIEHNGQKLVNRKTAKKPVRAAAIEGEALKKKRPAMPRTAQAREEARKRMKTRKKQQRKKEKK